MKKIWEPFLESLANFSGPKSNTCIQIKKAGPSWKFYHIICKTIDTSILNVNNNSSPFIIGTFEKRAPSGG